MIDLEITRDESLMELYQIIADRLNQKGKIPLRARKYTQAIIVSHVYNRINDSQIEEEINIIKDERRNN
jgi:hypothetical protein